MGIPPPPHPTRPADAAPSGGHILSRAFLSSDLPVTRPGEGTEHRVVRGRLAGGRLRATPSEPPRLAAVFQSSALRRHVEVARIEVAQVRRAVLTIATRIEPHSRFGGASRTRLPLAKTARMSSTQLMSSSGLPLTAIRSASFPTEMVLVAAHARSAATRNN